MAVVGKYVESRCSDAVVELTGPSRRSQRVSCTDEEACRHLDVVEGGPIVHTAHRDEKSGASRATGREHCGLRGLEVAAVMGFFSHARLMTLMDALVTLGSMAFFAAGIVGLRALR